MKSELNPQGSRVTPLHRRLLDGFKVYRFYRLCILCLLFGACTLFYYFGELVDFVGWGSLRWEFFYGVHDIHRLFFLVPIVYAGYFLGMRATVIVTIASMIVFLPRAIIISPFPDPVARVVLFVMIAGIAGMFVAAIRHGPKGRRYIEGLVGNETDKPLETRNEVEGEEVFTAGNLEVNLSKRLVRRGGESVKLTRKEYELLAYFVRNSGKALTHKELLHAVWGPEYGQESEYIRNFIAQLRRKIEDDPSRPQLIVTEPSIGYRFVGPEQHIR